MTERTRVQEESPVSQISKVAKKRLKFANSTICKISGPDNDFLDVVIAYLATGFYVSPTSAKMFDDNSRHFFQFFKVQPKDKEA
jgi:hypothetical protein